MTPQASSSAGTSEQLPAPSHAAHRPQPVPAALSETAGQSAGSGSLQSPAASQRLVVMSAKSPQAPSSPWQSMTPHWGSSAGMSVHEPAPSHPQHALSGSPVWPWMAMSSTYQMIE